MISHLHSFCRQRSRISGGGKSMVNRFGPAGAAGAATAVAPGAAAIATSWALAMESTRALTARIANDPSNRVIRDFMGRVSFPRPKALERRAAWVVLRPGTREK